MSVLFRLGINIRGGRAGEARGGRTEREGSERGRERASSESLPIFSLKVGRRDRLGRGKRRAKGSGGKGKGEGEEREGERKHEREEGPDDRKTSSPIHRGKGIFARLDVLLDCMCGVQHRNSTAEWLGRGGGEAGQQRRRSIRGPIAVTRRVINA